MDAAGAAGEARHGVSGGLAGELADALLPRCRFPEPGTEVVCGVSGGPDSSALAILAVRAGCAVTIHHVDHGLRTEAAETEAEVVRRLGVVLDVPVTVLHLALRDGADLERRARDGRAAVLGPAALLGHTADDLAETMLLQLVRGTGPEGLVSMRREVRPILGLRRAETVALCAEAGIETVDDPTNASLRFRRNRMRHEVVPLLSDVAERDVVPLLVRFAELQLDANRVIDALAAELDVTDAAAVGEAEPAVARVAIRRWWRATTGERYAPESAAVQRVLDIAEGTARSAEVGGGWRVSRTAGRLRLHRG